MNARTADILERLQVRIHSIRLHSRPDCEADQWSKAASHWQTRVYREEIGLENGTHRGKDFTVFYSMGSAYTGKPKTSDVIHSLLMDSEAAEESFEDWCSNFGYDSDSRKAERTYRACMETAKKMHRLFTEAELAELREAFSEY